MLHDQEFASYAILRVNNKNSRISNHLTFSSSWLKISKIQEKKNAIFKRSENHSLFLSDKCEIWKYLQIMKKATCNHYSRVGISQLLCPSLLHALIKKILLKILETMLSDAWSEFPSSLNTLKVKKWGTQRCDRLVQDHFSQFTF